MSAGGGPSLFTFRCGVVAEVSKDRWLSKTQSALTMLFTQEVHGGQASSACKPERPLPRVFVLDLPIAGQ
jgi:hypothetical protein